MRRRLSGGGGHGAAAESRTKATAVCVSVNTRDPQRLQTFTIKPTEQTDFRLQQLGRCFMQQRCGEGGYNPSLVIQLPGNSEAQLAKTDFKKKQKQKSQTAQNGLNLIYSVVYSCN